MILATFKMISDVTCIRFVKHTVEEDYIIFVKGKGWVSKVGGMQPLYYGRGCQVENICHELMHRLGLYHERTRFDRDRYVHINWKNNMKGKKNCIKKTANTLNVMYDIESIMHYGPYFFSKNQKPTMELINNPTSRMGQKTKLTNLDIQKLNRLYRCTDIIKYKF
ncbi:hypothetical protein NQD34_017801 [Periophthalmus magnuspinnatus]|nr:hypothetical protein NQD34_017801 [Periophthalmus magnuspinnatus]